MRRGAKDPELFDIVPGTAGEPWTINGEPTEADTPRDAINRVHTLATRFPAQVNIHDGKEIIALELDKRARTRPMPEAPAAAPVIPATPAVAPVDTPAEDITPVGLPEGSVPAEPSQDSEGTDRPRRLVTPLRAAGAVILVTVLGVAGLLAAQGSDDEQVSDTAAQEPTPTPQGWSLPSGQSAVSIVGDQVITSQGSTVRALDAETGDEVWSVNDVDNAPQVRSMQGTAASAVDLGAGEVAVLIDGEVSMLPGALNARGTEPVIISGREYTTFAGTTRPLEATQAVLGAVAGGVVLLESPSTVVVEGMVVELAAPEAEAAITQAIRVTDDRAVMVWSRGDERWLVTHDLATGDVELEEDIGAAEVTVRSGIVRIGSDQYLVGDEIQSLCEGGEQVNATILCPTNEGWESDDGTMQYPERPDAISPSYTVTAGTVTQRNTP